MFFAAKVDRFHHPKRKRWLLWAKCGKKGRFGTKYPVFRDEKRGIREKLGCFRDEKIGLFGSFRPKSHPFTASLRGALRVVGTLTSLLLKFHLAETEGHAD